MNLDLILVFLVSIFLSMLAIHVSALAMHRVSITDKPNDDHKHHDENIPFVGGVGVLAALSFAFIMLIDYHSEYFQKCIALIFCSIIIFITGFLDDVIKLGYKPRFLIQTGVSLIMIFGGGVVLNELGGLLFGFPLQLGIFGATFTIFATTGVINALNMIDGVDGLSGTISLVSLLLIGTATLIAGDQHNLMLICALTGGIAGFLYFNFRHPTQHHARVFLGDNGSMLLGLMFAWLLIDLSQGSNPAISPVTAIWLFSVPLMDAIAVMLRRICAGQSPFASDRQHLHHLLMRSGFRVTEIVFCLTFFHGLLGIIGLTGLYLEVSEFGMLLGYFIICIVFFYLTYQPQRFISMLRHFQILLNTRLGFAPASNNRVLIGSYSARETEELAKAVSDELGTDMNFSIRVFGKPPEHQHVGKQYAITLNIWPDKDNCTSKETLKRYITLLQQRLIEHRDVHLHHFSTRKTDYDPVIYSEGGVFGEPKVTSRRRLGPQALSFEITL